VIIRSRLGRKRYRSEGWEGMPSGGGGGGGGWTKDGGGVCGVILRRRFGRKRWRSEGCERRPSVREQEIGWWRSVWSNNKEI
jgi:hypothetical protein